MEAGAEGREGGGVRMGVKTHHEAEGVGREIRQRKNKAHGLLQFPVVGRIGRVIERHDLAGHIAQLNVFVVRIFIEGWVARAVGEDKIKRVARTVHNLVDDQRADFWVGVGLAHAEPELRNRVRLVCAERGLGRGHKLVIARHARLVIAEGNAVGGRLKGFIDPIAGEAAIRTGLREDDVVATRGVKGERADCAGTVEPDRRARALVNRQVAEGRHEGVGGD